MTAPLADRVQVARADHEGTIVRSGTERWRAHCSCGRWRSSLVADRRTAFQAFTAHRRDPDAC